MIFKRIYSLDALKCLATTLIVFHHYQQTFHDIPGRRIAFYGGSFFFGYLVELFFLISGFLIFKYEKRIQEGLSFRRFFFRRYLRLLPLMVLSTTFYMLLTCGFFFDTFRLTGEVRGLMITEKPSVWGWLITCLGLQAGWGLENPCLNNPLWYISVLLACYLFFFLFVRLAARLRVSPRFFYAGMLLLGLSLSRHAYGNLPFLTGEMGRGYCSFFPGLLLAAFWENRQIDRRAVGLCLIIPIGFLLGFATDYGRALLKPGMSQLLPLLVWPALVTLVLSEPAQRLFCSPKLGTLGAVAFDVYSWHDCANLLFVILGETFSWNPFFFSVRGMLVCAVCVWLFGAFSHFCIEKPLARYTDRLLEKR